MLSVKQKCVTKSWHVCAFTGLVTQMNKSVSAQHSKISAVIEVLQHTVLHFHKTVTRKAAMHKG